MTTDPATLYKQRLTRYQTAMDVGKPDKVPMRLMLDAFMAKYAVIGIAHV